MYTCAIYTGGDLFSQDARDPRLSQLNCTGVEESIIDCRRTHKILGPALCPCHMLLLSVKVRVVYACHTLISQSVEHYGVTVRVVTFFPDISTTIGNCEHGDLRLVNGSNVLEGRVEICINNGWGTICTEGVSEDDVTVICGQISQSPMIKWGNCKSTIT